MATIKGSRNNTLAGTLVIVSIIATLVIVVLLAGARDLFGRKTYTVAFDFETGVEGIAKGSEIALGGRQIGSVASVLFYPEGAQTFEAIHVVIGIESDYAIREGAVAYLEKPLLGSTSKINFVSLGDGTELTEADAIPGILAPPGFLKSAGYGEEQKTKVQSVIDDAEEFMAMAKRRGNDFDTEMYPRINDTTIKARDVITDAKAKWGEWSGSVSRTLSNVETMTNDGREFMAGLDADVESVRSSIVDAIEENRENLDATIANARTITSDGKAFSARLNGELADKAVALLDSGQSAMDKAGNSLDEARAILAEQRPNINTSMANFRLTSDQLKDTLLEIRASPWRLLYRPDMRELEYELLYNSARSYARAVGELRVIADRMDTLLAKPQGELTELDREAIAGFADDLARTRKSYEQVEDAFLDQLLESRGR